MFGRLGLFTFIIAFIFALGWLLDHHPGQLAQRSRPNTELLLSNQVDSQFIEHTLRPENCYSDERTFLACMAIIDRALEFDHRALELVPGPVLSVDRFLGTALKDFGSAYIRLKVTGTAKDFSDLMKSEKIRQQEQLRTWLKTANSPSGPDFRQVWGWIVAEIESIRDHKQSYGYIFNAYLAISDDPHTQMISLTQLNVQFGDKSQALQGYGVDVRRMGGHFYIHNLMPEGAAARAGLKVHDIFEKINGESLNDKSLGYVLDKVSSLKDLNLVVNREGHFATVVVRPTEVQMPESVKITYLENGNAEVRIFRFAKGTCDRVQAVFSAEKKPQQIDLNLQSNLGGDVQEGVCVASLFLPNDRIVAMVKNLSTGTVRKLVTSGSKKDLKTPIRVYVDHRTASSSEMVAAALKGYGRATVIGEVTYGKATMQEGYLVDPQCQSNCKVLLKTTGLLMDPKGHSWHLRGLKPDDFKISRSSFRLKDEPFYWVREVLGLTY